MRRALVMAGAGVALATALMVTLTTGATAAPLGPVNQANTAESGDGLLTQVHFRGHGFRHNRGASFGFFLGAPLYYSYSNCWWSHRWHRRVCSY